tara:strand:- start:20 stop:427 length:408 start_codon:yes stop_codon:yes gene_type:complete
MYYEEKIYKVLNEAFRVRQVSGGPTKKTKSAYNKILEKIFSKVQKMGGGSVETVSEERVAHPYDYNVKVQLGRPQPSGKHRDWLFVKIEKKTGNITINPKGRSGFGAGSIKDVNKAAKIINDWSDKHLYFGESVE